MNTKTTVMLVLKVIILTILLVVIGRIAFAVVGLRDAAQAADPTGTIIGLLIARALQTIVLSYVIIRSRWSGWRLVVTTFVVFYGIEVFLSLIEAVAFLQHFVDIIPAEEMPKMFLHGAITTALFSPLAVLVHGKMKGTEASQEPNLRLVMPWTVWTRRLILIAIIYMVIYFLFGIFVAMPLGGEAFQEYYGDLQLPAWIFPFQLLRGLIFTALALPVIRMMKGRWWEAGLAVALLFSVLMAAGLFVPQEFMPGRVRMAHFVEIFSSNFLFGWIVVWVLNRRHGSRRKISERSEGNG